jgi:hypothetical protein
MKSIPNFNTVLKDKSNVVHVYYRLSSLTLCILASDFGREKGNEVCGQSRDALIEALKSLNFSTVDNCEMDGLRCGKKWINNIFIPTCTCQY